MKYDKLRVLIDHFEQFEEETGSSEVQHFAQWLVLKQTQLSWNSEDGLTLDAAIFRAFSLLTNHAKHYIKTLVKDTPLVGVNDLVVLTVLYYSGDQRKTEVLQSSVIELSSGIEVIKRLLRLGLLEEYPDVEDRRAKKVCLTDKGRELYAFLVPQIQLATQVVVGNLTVAEKHQLIPLLQKLVHFHAPIFQTELGTPLEVLVDKYQVAQ